MSKLPLLLLGLMLGTCGVLRAQSFDLTSGRVPVASIDGLWRFHTGDNPAWADPHFDDSGWSLLRSDRSWSGQGYKDYSGMAWYRFQVTVPAELDHVSLYLPQIFTCYEVYADGRLIGTYGKMPPNSLPYGGGGRFQVYSLPGGKHGKEMIGIALRVWHWPGWAMSYGGGPRHGGGLIGDSDEIDQRVGRENTNQLWSMSSGLILGLLESLAGLAALAVFLLRRGEPEYLWFSLVVLFDAMTEWILVSAQLHVGSYEVRDLASGFSSSLELFAAIAFYQQLLKPKRTWLLNLAITAVALPLLERIFASLSGNFLGLWFDPLTGAVSFLILSAWILSVVFAAAWRRLPEAGFLVVPVASITGLGLYADIAWATYTLGWQHWTTGVVTLTEKPFPILLWDVIWGFFLLAVFAILILRFTRTRSQEERYAGEVMAARRVQQFLIPEHLPITPGLAIESVYKPAREVGGDFFQVLPDAQDGSVLIAVGDVAGKGMEAGMLATLIVGAIRTAAAFTTDPARILALLNERLQGRGLVTCLALRIERDGSATLVNAAHLPPYINGQELPMEGALPLGALPDADFPVLHFLLAEGDTLTLMSDGIAEAQDANGHLFGFERIGTMLSERATAASLASAAQDFGQEDDITVLTVARLAPAMIG